ncbi:MAG TPA: sulfatase [Candidatus Hydrogenedens sp.]|nr:sulfatase [Candidatus Hydrogenedens sp.]
MKWFLYRKLSGKTFVDRYFLFFFYLCSYIGLIGSVSWSEESVFRFSKEYWENKGKNTALVLEGKEWEKNLDKKSEVLSFSYKSNIDLGEYRFIRVYLISECGNGLQLGWESKRLEDKIFIMPDKIGLINDGKLHAYTFTLRFIDGNNPIFDITDKVYLSITGIEENKKIDLVKVEFLPYEDARPRQITIGSVCMDVLWNKEVSFTKKIEEESYLEFYTGIYNPALGSYCKVSKEENWDTDGLEFLIDIVYEGEKETLYQSEMKPKSNAVDRNWRRVELNLSKYANLDVKFIFKMGALGNEIGDFGVWGNPMIISKSKQAENHIPIFIISCDTLRPDHLLPYGYDLPTSPHLDKFARDAVVFENAYTTQTFTPVAHMSLLTGKYPENHGLTRNTDIFSHVLTLSEVLIGYGYQTAGFAGFLWWFVPSRGFSRGMDFFSVPEKGREGNRRSVFEVHEEAKEWIYKTQNKQIFVFLHNYDVHSKAYGDLIYDAEEEKFKLFSCGLKKPQVQHEGCEEILSGALYLQHIANGDIIPTEEEISYICALYDDCVYKVDCALDDFFNFLKEKSLYDPAMIVIVSDHGESLGEHGLYGHDNVYEESAKAVSIIKFPFNKYAGLRVNDRVSLEDIMPTVLNFLNGDSDLVLDGHSVLQFLKIGERKTEQKIIFTSSLRGDMRAEIKDSYKLLEDIPRGIKSLFDLRGNVPEYYDLSSKEPEIFEEMSESLSQKFALEKKGWLLYFLSTASFWTGTININCSVPILFSKIQGGVLRTKNERTSPTELKADVFLPRSSTPAVIQIVPVDDTNELKIHIQGGDLLKCPSDYNVMQTRFGKFLCFVSNGIMNNKENLDEKKEDLFFWVEYYPQNEKDKTEPINISDEAQDTLRNLGYLN